MKDYQKEELVSNLSHLMQRSFLFLVRPHVSYTPILELIDKELKIANCALKAKKKPDYAFETIKVNFKRVRSGIIILSSKTGFTINLTPEHAEVFDQWVETPAALKSVSWKRYMLLGNKELGYRKYEVYDEHESMKGSISQEMRRRHKSNHHYDILNGVADTVLEKK